LFQFFSTFFTFSFSFFFSFLVLASDHVRKEQVGAGAHVRLWEVVGRDHIVPVWNGKKEGREVGSH
jgi:hypothetical protein